MSDDLREALFQAVVDRTPDEYIEDFVTRILALPALRDLLAERDKLAAQVQAVEAIHVSDGDAVDPTCVGCRAECAYCEAEHPWPCATRRALIAGPLRDVIAERDELREQIRMLEAELTDPDIYSLRRRIRRALGTPTTGGGE